MKLSYDHIRFGIAAGVLAAGAVVLGGYLIASPTNDSECVMYRGRTLEGKQYEIELRYDKGEIDFMFLPSNGDI